MSEAVRFGVDELLRDRHGLPTSARMGLVTNDAASTASDGRISRAALLAAGYDVVRLFSPEHGMGASAEDGAAVSDAADPLTGLPIFSLYGQTTRPPRKALDDLDLVMFDIPDVGSRFYTYIWTLSHVLEACAEAKKPLWVLDRPNPIGGELAHAEGPMLDDDFVSTFVGRWPMPIRHSLTIGELAQHWNTERMIGAELRVIRCGGWRRWMHWPDTRLPFVPTSPAIRDYETALVYPGTCLFEGTNISEGRGTDLPFRMIGAPWLDGERIAALMTASGLASARLEPARFTPTARKYAGVECRGLLIDVIEPRAFRPVATALRMLYLIVQTHRQQFSWEPYRTAENHAGIGHFDRLIGRPLRDKFEQSQQDLNRLITMWTNSDHWRYRVQQSLLYE